MNTTTNQPRPDKSNFVFPYGSFGFTLKESLKRDRELTKILENPIKKDPNENHETINFNNTFQSSSSYLSQILKSQLKTKENDDHDNNINQSNTPQQISQQQQIGQLLDSFKFNENNNAVHHPTRYDFLRHVIDDELEEYFFSEQGELSIQSKSFILGEFGQCQNPSLSLYAILKNKPKGLLAILNAQLRLHFPPNDILFQPTPNSIINIFHFSIEQKNDCCFVIHSFLKKNLTYFQLPSVCPFDSFTPTSYFVSIFFSNGKMSEILQNESNPFLRQEDSYSPFQLAIIMRDSVSIQSMLGLRDIYKDSWNELLQYKYTPNELLVTEKIEFQGTQDNKDDLAGTKQNESNETKDDHARLPELKTKTEDENSKTIEEILAKMGIWISYDEVQQKYMNANE